MTTAPRRHPASLATAFDLALGALLGAALLAAAPARADSIRCDPREGAAGGDRLGRGRGPRPPRQVRLADPAGGRRRDPLAPDPGPRRHPGHGDGAAALDLQPRPQPVHPGGAAGGRPGHGGGAGRLRLRPREGAGQPPIPRARCDQLAIREGDTTLDLLARCGPPATQDQREESYAVEVLTPAGPTLETRTRVVERWGYDFGPRILTRHATVAGGRVRKVETGGYGYSR